MGVALKEYHPLVNLKKVIATVPKTEFQKTEILLGDAHALCGLDGFFYETFRMGDKILVSH